MNIQDFFQTYFIHPALVSDEVYNIYNTLAYGLILVAMVFAVYKVLKKFSIRIDRDFFMGAFPFIVLAGVLRVLRDAGQLTSPLFIAPLIYITIFAIAFITLIATVLFERYVFNTLSYSVYMFSIGWLLVFLFGLNLKFVNPIAFAQILYLAIFISLIIYILGKPLQLKVFSYMNLGILSGAMFDASSTTIGIAIYSYMEKHVLPNLLIGYTNAWIMLPLKFIVVFFALWVIDNYETNEDFKNFLKFVILSVTLGPGVRNTLRLAAGV